MRLRICRRLQGSIDGVAIDHLQIGLIYEIGTQIASVLLAEGWAEPAGAADDTRLSPRPPPTRLGPLVLIVDDEPHLRQMAADLLIGHGYGVVMAQHGVEALARLCEHCPDLVLLDLNMPVMDGWQFRAAQERLAEAHLVNIPVLILTGADGATEHAATLKAAGLIEKPFHPDQLLSAVRMALRAA
jgi:two-component system, OmpR family, alkaline phosphatase synthesis response regulator PhoP